MPGIHPACSLMLPSNLFEVFLKSGNLKSQSYFSVMASHSEVLKYLKLSVSVEGEPSKDVKGLLADTVLGTPGKLRYRHTSFNTKLPFLGQIYFLVLRKSDKLLGCIAFSKRETFLKGSPVNSWYIRYFSIRAPLRAKSHNQKKRNKHEKERPQRDNLLKLTAQKFFDDPTLLDQKLGNDPGGDIVYAYVEKENVRSWNFTDLIGFETVGKIHTSFFSRFNPKKDPHVHTSCENDKKAILSQLREFYQDHTFYTEHNIFFGNNYLVWKENDEIVAGCQANPEVWKLVEYPGLLNKFFLKVLVRLPIMSKRFDPGYLKFMAMEGIWYRKGYEKCLLPLFESACARHDLYLGIIWLDSKSHLYRTIRNIRQLGIIDKFLNPAVGDIRVKFINWKEEDKGYYYKQPAYISCFDMT